MMLWKWARSRRYSYLPVALILYRLIRSLVTEAAVQTSSFEDLVDVVKDYCEPSIVQRYKFNT